MVTDTRGMTGAEKASVLLMSLDPKTSTEVMKHLSAEQQEILVAQIVRMQHVGNVTRRRVLEEVRVLVQKGLAHDQDSDATPFAWMDSVASETIAELLDLERPQNCALVIAHLKPQAAALVLSAMDEAKRNLAAQRLAGMRGVSAEAIRAVDELLRERYSKLGTSCVRQSVTRVVCEVECPEDLVFLPDSELKAALAAVSTDDVLLILQVASEDLRSAIMANLSEAASAEVRTSRAETLRPKVREVEEAQQRLLEAARRSP